MLVVLGGVYFSLCTLQLPIVVVVERFILAGQFVCLCVAVVVLVLVLVVNLLFLWLLLVALLRSFYRPIAPSTIAENTFLH
eukprot:m.247451 g.247451  ORF g.247451 m.247451 type:complete len:81 (-) comp15393_c1_seq1:84-326(-)